MIQCPVCKYENPDDATVCLNCGARIETGRLSQPIDDISEDQTLLMSGPPPGQEGRPTNPPPPNRRGQSQQQTGAGTGGVPPGGHPGGVGPGLPPLGTGPVEPPDNINTYLVISIVLLVLTLVLTFLAWCCFPIMIGPLLGLIFSILAMTSANRGDYAGAHSQIKIAKVALIVTAIVFGVSVLFVGLVILVFGAAMLGGGMMQ